MIIMGCKSGHIFCLVMDSQHLHQCQSRDRVRTYEHAQKSDSAVKDVKVYIHKVIIWTETKVIQHCLDIFVPTELEFFLLQYDPHNVVVNWYIILFFSAAITNDVTDWKLLQEKDHLIIPEVLLTNELQSCTPAFIM